MDIISRGRVHNSRVFVHSSRGRVHNSGGRVHSPRIFVHSWRGGVQNSRGRVRNSRVFVHSPGGRVHSSGGRVRNSRGDGHSLWHTRTMPIRPSKPKSSDPLPRRKRDSNQRDGQAVGEPGDSDSSVDAGSPENLVAVALGRLGGSKGEKKAPAASLTPAQRREIARRAARKR